MRFLFASDSFKGSLSSGEINSILTKAAGEVFPGAECVGLKMADGGEGTVDAVLEAAGGMKRTVRVSDPLDRPVYASYAILDGGNAVIEMAAASGLPLLLEEEKDPLLTTTYGTGELILDALRQGCVRITLAIGGSATNDGGMGAMRALGVRFLDTAGGELKGCGADLERVARIDTEGIEPLVKKASFTIMCDVDNPLTGPEGAAYTFAPQKGADEARLERLERGMTHYALLLKEQLGKDVGNVPGAGAAGGLGAGLMAFLEAAARPGVETVLDLCGFDELLKGTDLVITGEGRMDAQSAHGKVPAGVGRRCKAAGVPAVAIVGSLGEGYEAMYEMGIASIMTTVDGIMDLEEAIERAEELYYAAAIRTFRMVTAVQFTGMYV